MLTFLFAILNEDFWVILKKFLSSSCKDCTINVGKNWTLQTLITQYLVLVLKFSPVYIVSLNTVFSIPQNQCYFGTPCTRFSRLNIVFCSLMFLLQNIKQCLVWQKLPPICNRCYQSVNSKIVGYIFHSK